MAGVGPWAASIYNLPSPLSDRLVCFDGREGTVGGAALLGR